MKIITNKAILILLFTAFLLCGCGTAEKKEIDSKGADPPCEAYDEKLNAGDNCAIADADGTNKTEQPEKNDIPVEKPQQAENSTSEKAYDKTPKLKEHENPQQKAEAPQQEAETLRQETVTISIKGVDEKANILPKTAIVLSEGETVYDILQKIIKEKSIQAEFAGSKRNVYIKGIDNLYEFDKGAQSGWIYSVNGDFPQKSCGAYALKKDDIVEFIYTVKQGDFNL